MSGPLTVVSGVRCDIVLTDMTQISMNMDVYINSDIVIHADIRVSYIHLVN